MWWLCDTFLLLHLLKNSREEEDSIKWYILAAAERFLENHQSLLLTIIMAAIVVLWLWRRRYFHCHQRLKVEFSLLFFFSSYENTTYTLLSRDPLLVYFFTQLLKRCKSIFWLWRKRCSFIFRHVGDLNARSAYSVSSVVIEAFVDSRGLLESFMQTLSIIYAKFEGKTHDGFDPNLPDWF